jgi:excisionase family DNA binding protein
MTTPNLRYKAEAVTVAQAADILSVSEKTIRRLIALEELKPVRLLRSVRIPIKQIKRLLEGQN